MQASLRLFLIALSLMVTIILFIYFASIILFVVLVDQLYNSSLIRLVLIDRSSGSQYLESISYASAHPSNKCIGSVYTLCKMPLLSSFNGTQVFIYLFSGNYYCRNYSISEVNYWQRLPFILLWS